MKKLSLVLAVLAFVSCKFDQNGNKNIIPADDSKTHVPVTTHVDDENVAVENNVEVAELDENGNYIYNVGEILTITLPSGETLEIGSNSTENQLFSMLNNSDFLVSDDKTKGWVTLDRVYFATGSDELTAKSQNQIENLSKIFKAFPNTEIKLGGYTDNTGSQQINQPLSEGRAKSVMNSLSSSGIDADRMNAEGYGSEHPVCPANDTDVCKAKNRRVEIRITKK